MPRHLLPSVVSARRRQPLFPVAPPDPPPTGEQQVRNFTADTTTAINNPERGFHKDYYITPAQLNNVRPVDNMSLNRNYFRLDTFRDAPISAAWLTDHAAQLPHYRTAGIKGIIRYSYNFGWEADAPLTRILQHIDQLAPIWQANADVIAVLQAGFIGAWGEWHSSTHGHLNVPAMSQITTALLNALPANRMVQIRYPAKVVNALGHSYDLAGWTSGAAPASVTTPFTNALVTEADRFTTVQRARVGHKNDSFLQNHTDYGTYAFREVGYNWNTAHEAFLRGWIGQGSRFLVMGGEMIEPAGRWLEGNLLSCSAAQAEMARVGWDYLNRDFGVTTINTWIANGCYDTIFRTMGHRLRLASVTAPLSVVRGTPMTLTASIANDGWGKVYNPRAIEIVMVPTGGGSAITLSATEDARRLLPIGRGLNPAVPMNVPLTVTVPGSAALGNYQLFLRLPDPSSATVRNDNRYSIQFANTGGIYNSTNGRHDLQLVVAVTG